MRPLTVLLFSVFLLFLIILAGCVEIPDCGQDFDCFESYAESCATARVNVISEGTNIRFTLRGIEYPYCKISLKVESVGSDISAKYPTESKIIVGKTLNCNINKNVAEQSYLESLANIEEEFDCSCSGPIGDLAKGPLKEIITSELNKVLGE